MITDSIASFFLTAFRSVVGLLPTWSPDMSAFAVQATSLGSVAATANGWFPVGLLGAVVVVVMGLKVVLFAWRALVFVYELIPFKMT